MVVLSADPGSRFMGYAALLVERRVETILEAGTITAPEHWPPWRRLGEIAAELERWCRDMQASPVVASAEIRIGVEDGFLKGKGILRLAEARGIAIATFARVFQTEVRVYQPNQVKLAATGSGRAKKDQVRMMMRARFKMQRTPQEDCADALATAVCRATDAT